jgi:hypothetical protein
MFLTQTARQLVGHSDMLVAKAFDPLRPLQRTLMSAADRPLSKLHRARRLKPL